MSSGLDRAVRDIIAAIQESGRSKTSPFDRTAKVVRVDEEAGIAWVHFPGGVDETPVNLTIAATAGDTVQVRSGGGKAWITGNATAPPTDDTTAKIAKLESLIAGKRSQKAKETADNAVVKAENAVSDAIEALEKANDSLATDTLHYLATPLSSGVTIDTQGWTTTVQTMTKTNKYLWTYHTYTTADGTTTNTDPSITGTYGEKGDKGDSPTITTTKDGKTTTIKADGVSIGTVIDGADGSSPTATVTKSGNTATITITDKNGTTTKTVTDGTDGDDGISVTAVQPQYYLSTSDQNATGGSWGTSLTYEAGKYIWTRDNISYSEGSPSYSTAIYNQALTQACSDAMQALEVAQEVNQYTWHTETDTGAGAGTHITSIPQDEFEAEPSGLNVLIDSVGAKIRNALKTMASYGLKSVIGEANKARVEIAPTVLEMISKDGATAIKIESSNQTAPSYIAVNINIPILYDTPAEFELDNTIPVGTVVTVEILDDAGYFLPTDFTIGTPYTYTDQYGYTIAYDGAYGFTATCTQAADALFTVSGARYTQTVYVPHTTLGGMVKITDTPFNSYSLVAPSISITDTYNGLVVNGVSITRLINSPNAMIDATGLTPVSSRCEVTGGGVIKVGKWRFVQLVLTIKASLSANNTYGILDGFDIANTSIVALASSVNKNYGNVSAQINASGRLVVQTSGKALATNDVLTVSGFYIAQ